VAEEAIRPPTEAVSAIPSTMSLFQGKGAPRAGPHGVAVPDGSAQRPPHGLIRSRGDTMYYKERDVREEVAATVIIKLCTLLLIRWIYRRNPTASAICLDRLPVGRTRA
jgi:hypothetical protein